MSRLARQAAREADEHAKTQALIIEAYRDNKRSLRDIARATDLSHEQVRRILAKHNVPIRARGRAKAAPATDAPKG